MITADGLVRVRKMIILQIITADRSVHFRKVVTLYMITADRSVRVRKVISLHMITADRSVRDTGDQRVDERLEYRIKSILLVHNYT